MASPTIFLHDKTTWRHNSQGVWKRLFSVFVVLLFFFPFFCGAMARFRPMASQPSSSMTRLHDVTIHRVFGQGRLAYV
jgi:hypothetical protein